MSFLPKLATPNIMDHPTQRKGAGASLRPRTRLAGSKTPQICQQIDLRKAMVNRIFSRSGAPASASPSNLSFANIPHVMRHESQNFSHLTNAVTLRGRWTSIIYSMSLSSSRVNASVYLAGPSNQASVESEGQLLKASLMTCSCRVHLAGSAPFRPSKAMGLV